jgi:prevent-host-death family protein
MSQTVTASEANQKFSELLRRVQQGHCVKITSRGKVVAEMIPSTGRVTSSATVEELLKVARKQPVRYAGDWQREDLYEK